MSISGNLRTMPFADLMQWVAQSRKTGTLAIEGPDFTKKIYFRDGVVIAAASENPKEYLGYYLVGWAYLSEEELQELLDMQSRYGTMLGELLVIVGRLSREELMYVLQVKTEETIYELFMWQEGEFRFLENILPAKKFQPLNLPVDMIVLEGIRRTDEWERAKEYVPESSWVPRVVRALDMNQMGETELAIIREINGQNSVEDIALACRVALFPVVEFIFQGAEAGLFELNAATGEARGIPGFTHGAWRLVVKKAEQDIEQGELLGCSAKIKELREKFESQREAQDHAAVLEKRMLTKLEEANLVPEAIPELAIAMSELTNVSCSPEEGFLLSRVNGTYSLGEICKMVPGSEIDVRLMVDAMIRRKILKLRQSKDLRAV